MPNVKNISIKYMYILNLKLRIYKCLFTKSIKNLFPMEIDKKIISGINNQFNINSLQIADQSDALLS